MKILKVFMPNGEVYEYSTGDLSEAVHVARIQIAGEDSKNDWVRVYFEDKSDTLFSSLPYQLFDENK